MGLRIDLRIDLIDHDSKVCTRSPSPLPSQPGSFTHGLLFSEPERRTRLRPRRGRFVERKTRRKASESLLAAAAGPRRGPWRHLGPAWQAGHSQEEARLRARCHQHISRQSTRLAPVRKPAAPDTRPVSFPLFKVNVLRARYLPPTRPVPGGRLGTCHFAERAGSGVPGGHARPSAWEAVSPLTGARRLWDVLTVLEPSLHFPWLLLCPGLPPQKAKGLLAPILAFPLDAKRCQPARFLPPGNFSSKGVPTIQIHADRLRGKKLQA